MPIRPERRHLYPPRAQWKAIRESVLDRAEHRCECRGECGHVHAFDHCNVPNHAIVTRSFYVAGGTTRYCVETWAEHQHDNDCLGERCPGVRVVLTIAHLDHDPTNNDRMNLRALCQRCHLRYDRHEHARNAAETRSRKRDEASGQLRLAAEEGGSR